MDLKPAVVISDLFKTFDGTDFVLNGLNLTIPCGKTTVIIGSSGTGKSVLIKTILGLIKLTSGSVSVLGQQITTMSGEQMTKFRCHYGMLFQDAALFDDQTALENVMFPLREHRPDLSEAERIQIARERLKESGLEEVHYEKIPSEMSGGMRKRVGLARALALDPEILIYDEPTTGLDPILTEVVNNLIRKTEGSHAGTTSILVSHDLYGAFKLADEVVLLDHGKVVLVGPPESFLNSEIELVKQFVSEGIHKTFVFKNGGSQYATASDPSI
jgi:phospholipid/cholesterol/gamma-HCH transport system ATP-binding protein